MTTQQGQALHVQGLVKSYKELDVLRGVGLSTNQQRGPGGECCAG